MSARNKRFIKQYGPAGDKRLIKTACALEVIQAYLEQVYPGKNIRLASPSGGNPHRGCKYDDADMEIKGPNTSKHTTGQALDIQLSIDGNPVGDNPHIVYAAVAKLMQSGHLPAGGLGYYETGNEAGEEYGLKDAAVYNKQLLTVEAVPDGTSKSKIESDYRASSCGPVGGRPSGHVHYDWRS